MYREQFSPLGSENILVDTLSKFTLRKRENGKNNEENPEQMNPELNITDIPVNTKRPLRRKPNVATVNLK